MNVLIYFSEERRQELVLGSVGCLPSILGVLAIGNVDNNRSKKSRRAFRRPNQRRMDVGPYDFTILATVTLFDPIATLRTNHDLIRTLSRRRAIVLVGYIAP